MGMPLLNTMSVIVLQMVSVQIEIYQRRLCGGISGRRSRTMRDAQVALGRFYELDIGMKVDYEKAI